MMENVSLEEVKAICAAGYNSVRNKTNRHIFLRLIALNVEGLAPGYYECRPYDKLVCQRKPAEMDLEVLKFAFDTIEPLEASSPFFFALVGENDADAHYEADDVAAGMVALCISGGARMGNLRLERVTSFRAETLKHELGLPEKIWPLFCLAMNKPGEMKPQELEVSPFPNKLKTVEKQFAGPGGLIKEYGVRTFEDGWFCGAFAKYGETENEYGGATSTKYNDAVFKACVEAYERKCVDENPAVANSSGVAAHYDYVEAERRALIELVERDAIMRTWQNRWPSRKVGRRVLSAHQKRRVEYWRGRGYKLEFLKLDSRYGLVILAVIHGEKYPCFTCGAAAAIENGNRVVDGVINKALMEAEYLFCTFERTPESAPLEDVSEIHTPTDHGHFYRFPNKNLKKLRWLWSSDIVARMDFPRRYQDYHELYDLVQAKTSELTLGRPAPGFEEFYVLRVESPDLVPIEFGNVQPGELPHFFS